MYFLNMIISFIVVTFIKIRIEKQIKVEIHITDNVHCTVINRKV